jgi:hypothetical protein
VRRRAARGGNFPGLSRSVRDGLSRSRLLDRFEREFRGERQLSRARRPTIRVATPTRAGEASSRASSVPTWRLGMPCEGSLRDAIRLAALAPANLVVRPDRLGMEAGAPGHPPADGSVLAAVAGRRTAGVNPLTPGSCHGVVRRRPRGCWSRLRDDPRQLGKGQVRLVGPPPLKQQRKKLWRRQNSPAPLAAVARRQSCDKGLGS